MSNWQQNDFSLDESIALLDDTAIRGFTTVTEVGEPESLRVVRLHCQGWLNTFRRIPSSNGEILEGQMVRAIASLLEHGLLDGSRGEQWERTSGAPLVTGG